MAMADAARRVLILAYYFPPMGMGGVQRIGKFVKYLPQFGWTPEVITVKSVHYHASDPALLDDIPSVKVHRTESLDPLRLSLLFHRRKGDVKTLTAGHGKLKILLDRLLIPDNKRLWLPFALWRALKLHRARPFDAIMTTSPPHSAHLAGCLLKKMLGIPWLADFRDGWWFEPHEKRHTDWVQRRNENQLRRVFNSLNAAITVSEDLVQQFQNRTGRPVYLIHNGYDTDDFPAEDASQCNPCFTLSYCGTLTAHMHPASFLDGVALALKQEPELETKLHLRWIGQAVGLDLHSELEERGLEALSEHAGYLSHGQAIEAMMSSHALLFLLPRAYGPGVITGKIFEYLATGKPILAMARTGEASALIDRFSAGQRIDPENVQGAAQWIINAYRQWKTQSLPVHPVNRQELRTLTRQAQTRQLASYLDKIC